MCAALGSAVYADRVKQYYVLHWDLWCTQTGLNSNVCCIGFCGVRRQEKARLSAPKGWTIELTDFSLGVHGPALSNFQVGVCVYVRARVCVSV